MQKNIDKKGRTQIRDVNATILMSYCIRRSGAMSLAKYHVSKPFSNV